MKDRTAEIEFSGPPDTEFLVRTVRRRLCRALACASIFVAVTAGSSLSFAEGVAPCDYSSIQVGNPLPCGIFFPSVPFPKSLNNLGHWAGYRVKCAPDDLIDIPLKWTPETGATVIPSPAWVTSARAYGINDIGTIVGEFSTSTPGLAARACIWLPDGQFIEIPPLGGNPPSSWANAVNNSNIVVGSRKVIGARNAFIWMDGELIEIDPLPFGTAAAEARAVSDTGFVVGQIGGDSNGSGRAFRWKDGALEILQPLPGAITSDAWCVNNAGTAFGRCQFVNGANITYRATVWGLDGVPTALQALPGYQSASCVRVNESGYVLGTSYKPSQSGLPSTQYVVWINGQVHSMTTLLGAVHGEPRDLNDLNQIVCGKSIGPLLFTPTAVMGDIDGDCVVNGADLMLLLEQWGRIADASADLNHDGTVDGADLAIVLGSWSFME